MERALSDSGSSVAQIWAERSVADAPHGTCGGSRSCGTCQICSTLVWHRTSRRSITGTRAEQVLAAELHKTR
eukprot:10268875-Prorocentrum_lima.AAC.1